MDALALLCNLYGDGPATLKRLRSAGCDSFGALDDLEPDQLAPILGTNEAAARRFLREARLLVERLEDEELEQEERPPLPAALVPAGSAREGLAAGAGESAAPPAAVLPPAAAGSGASARPTAPSGTSSGDDDVDARSSEVIDRVLATWRERDLVRAARDLGLDERALDDEDEDEDGVEQARGDSGDDEADAELDPEAGCDPETDEPGAELEVAGTPLVPRLLDGLDRLQCEALERAGFATLEELADADALTVGRQAELDLTRVLRLQFLARRLLADRGSSGDAEPAFSLAGPASRVATSASTAVAEMGPGSLQSPRGTGGDPAGTRPKGDPHADRGPGPGTGPKPDTATAPGSGARAWPLARGAEPRPPLPTREPRRGSAGPSPLDRVPLPAPREPREEPREADLAGPKFSMSEAPFGGAGSGLADELDRAARLQRRGDQHGSGPAEGTGGPFA